MKFNKRYNKVCPIYTENIGANDVISVDTSVSSLLKNGVIGAAEPSQFMGKPGEPVHIYKSFDLNNKPYDPTLNSYYIEKSKSRLQNGNSDKTTN